MAAAANANQCEPTQGPYNSLRFQRCARGFMLFAQAEYSTSVGQTWAFDSVEDLAMWLIEQYGSPETVAAMHAVRDSLR